MAHFLARIKGNRGDVTRTGSKRSGLSASINGWHLGCDVLIEYDERRKTDVVTVWKTHGSANRGRKKIYRFHQPPE